MVDHASTSIPTPKNWQDFERHCRVLFECILSDHHVQRNGRSGQAQHGVDVYGQRGGQGGTWVGVQCKGKDEGLEKKLTEAVLRTEVNKARSFKPALSEFIVVTTLPSDARIQEVARQITQENDESGQPLRVAVWGWSELESRIVEHPRALRAFHPDAMPISDEIRAGLARMETRDEQRDASIKGLHHKLDRLQATPPGLAVSDPSDVSPTEALDKELHAEIDQYRDRIGDGHPRTALKLLDALRGRIWEKASQRVRFRIVTNSGAAKLRLGDETGAASDILAAAKLQPNDPIGTANLALGHLLRGDFPAAIRTAREALEKHPTNANAASYLVQAHIDDSSVDDPLTLIPNELHDTAAVKLGLVNFYRRRKSSKWREAARTGASLFPDKDDLKRAAAEADLEEAFDTGGYLLGEQCTDEFDPRRLTEAAAVLHAAWNKLKASEDVIADSALPRNLAQVNRLLGKHETAAKVTDEGLRELPGNPELVKLRVRLSLAADDEECARSLLSADSNDPEIALSAAELEISRNPVAAREALAAIGKKWPDSEYALFADLLSVESYFQEGKFDQARKLARELAKKNPHNVEVLCALSSIERRTGDASASVTAVRAKDELTEESSFLGRFVVAGALEGLSRYDEAVDVLDGWVDSLRDTPPLRLLVSALINSDRRRRANELIKSLPKSVASTPYFLRAAAAIHLKRGDFSAAEDVLVQYLEMCPDDLTLRLQWIDIRLRRSGDEDVKNFLSGDVEALDGQPTDRMRLAHLLQHFGFAERALPLGYEVLLGHRDEPQVHLGYAGLLLQNDDVPGANLKPDEIGPDTVFVAENARSEKETYLIEPAPQLRQSEEAIPPDHLVAQKAVGLHVGESFTIKTSIDPPETWKIVSIKHKWIAALHQIMERFQRRFPAAGGLERVVVETEGEEAFKPVFARVKARHDAIRNVFDQYKKNAWPLSIVVRGLGSNTIETWQGLIQSGCKFRVCVGTAGERDAAFQAIRNNACKGCVVDALTLHIIRRLSLEEPVTSVCGSIGLTESSADVFRLRQADIASQSGRTQMTLFYKDGQYFRDETVPEQIEEALKIVEGDLQWIGQHCALLPAEGTQDLSAHMREVARRIGHGFFDEILAADGAGRLLVSEDHALRLLADQEVGVRTSWLQPVLIVARNRGVMTLDAYSEAIISLIELGHEFISVDAQILLAATKGVKGADKDRFQVVAKTLADPNAEFFSNVGVSAKFLKNIWSDPRPQIDRLAQTGNLLACLIRGRPEEYRVVIGAIRKLVNWPGFDEYLVQWLRGHFLL